MDRDIKLLKWFYFFLGFAFYLPIAIIYFSKISGSYALGFSIFSVDTISSAIFEIPTGIYSDLIGRRKTLFLGSVLTVLATCFYAVAQSYMVLFLGSIFSGLARSFYSGNNEAYLHDILFEYNREHDFSLYYSRFRKMEQLALAVSAVLGGFIAYVSLRWTVWLSILPSSICILIAMLLAEPKTHTKSSGNIYLHLKDAFIEFKQNKKLRFLSLGSMTTYALSESSFQFRSAFFQTVWPLWAIGFGQTLANIGSVISFHYSHRVLKKFGAMKSLIIGNLGARVMNMIGTAFPSVLSPFIMTTTSLNYGINTVAKEYLLQKEFKNQQRATMGSLNSFGGNLLFGIVAIGIGYFADLFSPAKALFYIQILTACTIYFYIMIERYEKIKVNKTK